MKVLILAREMDRKLGSVLWSALEIARECTSVPTWSARGGKGRPIDIRSAFDCELALAATASPSELGIDPDGPATRISIRAPGHLVGVNLWTDPRSLLVSLDVSMDGAAAFSQVDLKRIGSEVILIVGASLERVDGGVRPRMGWRTEFRGARLSHWRSAFPDGEQGLRSFVVAGHRGSPDSKSVEDLKMLEAVRERARQERLLPVLPATRLPQPARRQTATAPTKGREGTALAPSYLKRLREPTEPASIDRLTDPSSAHPPGAARAGLKASKPPYHVIATEELPPSEELERLIHEADPRTAIARAAVHAPNAIPVNKAFTQESLPKEPEADVDETLMVLSPFISPAVPTGSFRDAMTPLVMPTFSIAEYARFRAALRFHGEENERTLRLFGVASIAVRNALQVQFASRFQSDAAGQAEFLKLFEQYLRALNAGNR